MTRDEGDLSVLQPMDPPATTARDRWLPVAGAALVFAVLLGVLYGSILVDLVAQWWDDPNYSHGFVVPLFAAMVVWQRRETLLSLAPRGTAWGLVVLAGGVAELLLGDIGGENFLMRSSLLVILAGLVLFHLGSTHFRLLAFPLGFLAFMIPWPAVVFYAVAFPLQQLAAQNAAWTLDLLGVPVLLDGNVIQLSQITLGVTEACSGIRSLISLLALAVGCAYVTQAGGWGMLGLATAAVPITLVANAGRVVATGLIGQWFGVRYAQGFFHTFSGWLIFVVAFLCLLGVLALGRGARAAWMRRRA